MVPSSRRMRISIGSSPSSAYFGFRTRGGTSTKSTGLPSPRAYSIAIADQSLIRRSDSSSEALSSIRSTCRKRGSVPNRATRLSTRRGASRAVW